MVRLTLSVPRPVLLLALAAVAAVIAGPTFAQDLSPLNTFFTTLGNALSGPMVMRTGTGQSRRDVLDYAVRTIDLIVQVGRRGGRRGVLEVYLPALEMLEQTGVG